MSNWLKRRNNQRKDRLAEQETEMEMKLNKFSTRMIMVIGIIGAVIGLALIILFWTWIISLFR
jgi:hypothetical protein